MVEADEIVANANGLLTRDIDLDGRGLNDAVSFGTGFHLAPADFVGIGE